MGSHPHRKTLEERLQILRELLRQPVSYLISRHQSSTTKRNFHLLSSIHDEKCASRCPQRTPPARAIAYSLSIRELPGEANANRQLSAQSSNTPQSMRYTDTNKVTIHAANRLRSQAINLLSCSPTSASLNSAPKSSIHPSDIQTSTFHLTPVQPVPSVPSPTCPHCPSQISNAHS